jgi:tRNA nucleotidyltransferase (CCA-adding enzyme)
VSEDAAAGYEFFDVEADVGVRAWGPTRAAAFGQAALGVLAVTADPASVEPRETREVRAQADSALRLLAAWINECLYVHEIEGFVARRVDVLDLDDGRVVGLIAGEEIDVQRHRLGTVVKAVTLHGLALSETPGRVEARIVVDV